MIDLVDTHCHLDFEAFEQDRQDILDRASEGGIQRILNPGIDVHSSQKALHLSEQFDLIYCACGVHPNDALSWDEHTLGELRRLASHPKVVAIGEIGLDYYRDRAPGELQKKVFYDQLALAAELQLPVVIHSRDSMHDILDMLFAWHKQLVDSGSRIARYPGVLHSFSGNCADAERAVAANFFLGVTGPVTYKNAADLRETISSVPLSSILIETDAPFLTPQPQRGKRNEPSFVRYTAEKIAEIQQLSLEVVAEYTTANSKALFSW